MIWGLGIVELRDRIQPRILSITLLHQRTKYNIKEDQNTSPTASVHLLISVLLWFNIKQCCARYSFFHFIQLLSLSLSLHGHHRLKTASRLTNTKSLKLLPLDTRFHDSNMSQHQVISYIFFSHNSFIFMLCQTDWYDSCIRFLSLFMMFSVESSIFPFGCLD